MNKLNLVSNIDTICILLNVQEYEERANKILNMLEEEKDYAKKIVTSNKTYKHYIKVGNINFELLTNGTKGYSYILQNSAYKIYLAKYEPTLQGYTPIQIRISSEYLWSYGISKAWSIIYHWVEENFGEISEEKVSRVDLCTHVANVDFITDYEKSYKGDFKKSQVFKTNNVINAITFGSRQSKNIYCRIYNKSLELKEKRHKTWFKDIWESNNIDTENVWNIEFEIKSELLRRFNLNTVNDVIWYTKDLWEFCTKKWIVKVDRTNKRVERCETNSDWEKIQNAFPYLTNAGLIDREKQINMDADVLIPTIAGFVTSYSARRDINSIEKAINEIGNKILKYFERKNTCFKYEVKEKNKMLRERK